MDYRAVDENRTMTMAQSDIAIIGVGLNCITGTQPIDLFAAVGTHLGYTRPNFSIKAVSSKERVEHILTCALKDFDEVDMHLRFMSCMLPALVDAIESARLLIRPNKNMLFYLVLPASDTLRGDCVLINECHQFLQDKLSELGDIEIRIKTGKQSVTEHLMFVTEGLQDGHWDTVLFGAVDSLVHGSTCDQLARESRIQTTDTADGVIPGEAAGFVILERLEETASDRIAVMAWLKCLSVQQERNFGKGDRKRMSGLTQAIRSILATCEISQDNIDSLVLPLGTEHSDSIEWHQTEGVLWPDRHGSQDRNGDIRSTTQTDYINDKPCPKKVPEILNLNVSLGDIGVASLPVALILATARFDFTHPVCKRIFALESGDMPFRGAVYLESPMLDQNSSQELGDAA